MKKIKILLQYQYRLYVTTSKMIMPLIALLIFLGVCYTIVPVNFVDMSTISLVCIFFLLLWTGYSYQEIANPVSEQLLVLKLQSEQGYYLIQSLFLFLTGVMFSMIAVAFPILQNILVHFALYTRTVTTGDFAIIFLLHCVVAFAGGAAGSFFHPRIIRDRHMAVLLVLFMGVMGIVKEPIMQQLPAAGYVVWIFPPLAEFIRMFSGDDFFAGRDVAFTALEMGVYGCVALFFRVRLLRRNKF